MTAWTNRPRPDDYSTQIQILRSRPGKPLRALVTAADLVGAYVHYWKGRTKLCEHPNCEACDASRQPRWYGYLAVVAEATLNPAILELTPSCVPAIDRYLADHGTLRGALVKLSRANPRINARVILELSEGNLGGTALPAAPKVEAQLCKIWEVKAVQKVHPTGGTNGHAEVVAFHATKRV